MPKSCRLFRTRFGWAGYIAGDAGVEGILLPVNRKAFALELVEERWSDAVWDADVDLTIQEQLVDYFAGGRVDFSFPLDLSGCAPFAREVYKAAMTIPYGEVRPYGWISRTIGRPGASRAVGGVMGRNPLPPVVPCHRVIKGDGTLGGFSAEMGLPLKIRMLEMEGLTIRDGRVSP